MFQNLTFRIFGRFAGIFSNYRLSIFLLLCFMLGGTSQDVVSPKLILYILSLVIIGSCLTQITRESRVWQFKSMNIVLGLFVLMHILYLIPLPPELWSKLPGRQYIVEGYHILATDLPWIPLSLVPEKSLFSLFDFLPPVALLLMMGTVVTDKEIDYSIRAIGFFAISSVVLGVLQVSGLGDGFYFYEITNDNSAVGFFSNANHFGVFLLMTIPIVLFPAVANGRNYEGMSNSVMLFSIICILIALLGVGLTGSLGNVLLILPVVLATFFIWTSGRGRPSIYLIGIFGPLIAVFLFDLFLWENLQSEAVEKLANTHAMDRQTMFANTVEIGRTYFPIGTGPGSLADVYKLVEVASPKTIPHSHNDYLEIFAEFGAVGLFWMLLAGFWLAKNIWKPFQSSTSSIGKFFTIPIIVVLVHTTFDYSLRTISVMTLFVFSLCVLISSNRGLNFRS